MDLNQLVSGYLNALRERRLSDAHIQSVGYRLKRLVDGVGGETAVSAIDADVVGQHLEALEAVGLAYATLAGQKATIRAMFNWAMANGMAASNPTEPLTSRRFRYDYRPVRNVAAPRDALETVLGALDAYIASKNGHPRSLRDAALVSMVADSAKRRGELHNLRRSDVEIALRYGAPDRDGRMVYAANSHGKTGQVEFVFFEGTAVYLRKWLAVMPPDAIWLWVNHNSNKRLALGAMRCGVERVCAFAGVSPILFHSIRKRSVTDVIEDSGDAKVGQLLAGHSDERTTQLHYNNVAQSRVHSAAAQMAEKRMQRANGSALIHALFGRLE